MATNKAATKDVQGKKPIDRIRTICLALPEAHEKVFGGHTTPTFRVRDKIFVMTNDRHEMWCKAPAGAQQILVGSDPERFFAPPYVGPKGWIGMRLNVKPIDWELVTDLVHDSYRMTAPKRLLKMLAAE
jgi:hypothetical protein